MRLLTRASPQEILRSFAAQGDDVMDIAAAALALARLDLPGIDPGPYIEYLDALAQEAGETARPGGRELEPVVADLNAILFDRHGYAGDVDTYDDLDNANIVRVIDRRRGLPVAISILYMHAARAAGLGVRGLSFPGHFVIQLDMLGERSILDPFNGGVQLAADDLRGMLKVALGADAELTPDHYRAVTDVEVLLRLENNIKLRLVQQDRTADAAAIVDRMRLIAPDVPDLMREAGLLHAHAGNLRSAIEALEAFLDRETLPGARRDASELLDRLRANLN